MASLLRPATPTELGIDARRWQDVLAFANSLVSDGTLPALAFQVHRHGRATDVACFGCRDLAGQHPLHMDQRFLVASLTKPVVAMAVLLLVERGDLSLNDRVVDWVPEFSEAPKRNITIRHLLTHTSGLPDMLPNNAELRRLHSPISTFVSGTCHAPLEYQPGRSTQYQSMGYALLEPIIERATGQRCRDFLRDAVFIPLEMSHTCLGTEPGESRDDIAELHVPPMQHGGGEWNWNSEYWQCLGATWGGLISTVADLSRFCACILADGHGPAGRVFSSATIRTATENRLHDFSGIPVETRNTRGWGCGWRFNWLDHRSCFSDLLPATTIGHWGATGTLFWLDPASNISAVLLSTRPVEKNASRLTHLSNTIVAAFH